MESDLQRRVVHEVARLGKDPISLWSLKGIPKKKLATELWATMQDADVFGRSAQLAYYFFFAVFPGLVFISSILGLMGRAGSSAIDTMLSNLGRLLPPSAFQILLSAFHETARASGAGKLAFGAVFALWSATTGMTAIQDTLNAVYKARESRPIWKQYLIAIALTGVTSVVVFLALGVLFSVDGLIHFLHLATPIAVLLRITVWPLAFALLALMFAIAYYYAPDVKQGRWHWITPGAVVGILGWILASIGLRVYLHFFNRYSATYGSLGAVIILLTWFYVSGLMLLIGAAANSSIEGILTPARREAAEKQQLPTGT